MAAPVFLGDEVAAAGFRLAGAATRVPNRGEEAATFAAARAEAPLVLLDAALATRIPAEALRIALRAPFPLTVVVPDLQGEVALPDLAARLRRQLGIDT